MIMNRFISLLIIGFFIGCSPKLPATLTEQAEQQISVDLKAEEAFSLPDEIEESSGLEYFQGEFITINDSGGEPIVYFLNQSGELTDRKLIAGKKNIDWEDIAATDNEIFIGEFGNNYGNRTDLKIISFTGESVKDFPFSFNNQTEFAFEEMTTPFDCEAVFVMDDQCWLLTKNWAEGSTTIYQLAETEEKQSLTPLATYGADLLITGADYHPERKVLVCSGYKNFKNYLLLFPAFDADNFFQQPPLRIHLKGLFQAQVEGVCFVDDSIYFSTEKTVLFPQQVWKVDLQESSLSNYLKINE